MPKCTYCGQETDVQISGVTVCEQCANDREFVRRRFEKTRVNPLLGKPDKTTPRNGAPKWFVDDRDVRED